MNRRKYIEGVGAVVTTGAISGCTGGNGNAGDESGNGGDSGDTETDDATGSDDGDTETDDGNGDSPAYGVLSTSVTDQPNDIADFESLVVTIEGIWVKPSGADDDETSDEDGDDESESDGTDDGDADDDSEQAAAEGDDADDDGDESGEDEPDEDDGEESESDDGETDDAGERSGRYYIEFEEPQEADLVKLQGDNTQLVDETELEVGDYQFLQLNVRETNGVLEDGGDASVETPGNAPLQFKQAFEIRAEETTRFIADFAPFKRGNGSYLIRPVASSTTVLYGDEEYGGGEDSESTDETEETTEETGGADDDTSDEEGSGDGAGKGENGPPESDS